MGCLVRQRVPGPAAGLAELQDRHGRHGGHQRGGGAAPARQFLKKVKFFVWF